MVFMIKKSKSYSFIVSGYGVLGGEESEMASLPKVAEVVIYIAHLSN